MSLQMLEKPTGAPVTAKGTTEGYALTAETVPARTPLVAMLTITGTAAQLSTATGGDATSAIPWRIKVPSGGANMLWGSLSSQPFEVAAGGELEIKSATLAGWYAKSDGADIDIELLGAEDV
jgi:hypothetical protein